jgi:hypothetical protein
VNASALQPIQVVRVSTTIEQKLAVDTRTRLFRFVCSDCGRKGCWLERRDTVVRNAGAHEQMHAEGQP